MTIKNIFKNFITSNAEYNDNVSYRRIMMVNGIMSLTALIFFIFTYINFFVTQNHTVAIFDLVAGLASVLNILYLRIKKNIQISAFLAVIILIAFMITFILDNQNTHFGIIWSIFVPFIAINLNGKIKGLYLSIFFYSIMFYLAFDGIGTWNDGAWIMIDFIRFAIASIVLTLIIYMSESVHSIADKELQQIRVKERAMIVSLERQAITDGLTSMHNRHHFNEESEKILESVKNNNEFLAFLILDIDYFKNYNDQYGHQAGDEALVLVAKELMNFTKDMGYAFRMGGEEFAILTRSSNRDRTIKKFGTLNKRIEDLAIEHKDSAVACTLTVSGGLCIHKVKDDDNIDTLYKLADKALYTAKHSGRNRLEIVS